MLKSMAKIHLVANAFHIEDLFKVVANYALSRMSLRPARDFSVCFIYRFMWDRSNKKRKDIFFCQYCILYNKFWFVSICLLEGALFVL